MSTSSGAGVVPVLQPRLVDFSDSELPLMLTLMEPVACEDGMTPKLGAMTKYKTFSGEEIGGEKVWHYDFHNDDDDD
jgi:hypothetical protein